MTQREVNFTELVHQVISSQHELSVDNNKRAALQAAAEIISDSFADPEAIPLDGLVHRIGEMMAGETSRGLLITHKDELASVVVTAKLTEINFHGQPPFIVPTGSVFDMLFLWHQEVS